MTDDEDQVNGRAERALRTAFDGRGRAYDPVALDPARLRRSARTRALWRAGAVAAAVVVVVGGTSLSSGWWRSENPQAGPSRSTTPNSNSPKLTRPTSPSAGVTEPTTDTDRVRAENERRERQAGREADQVLASMPPPEGAMRASATAVPPLAKGWAPLGLPDQQVTRRGFWLVPADPTDLADWYTLNPPAGMTTDGGPHSVGGLRNPNGSWSQFLIYDGKSGGPASHSSAEVLVTPVGNRAGVRITVYTDWSPARPLLSFAPHDVTAVRIVVERNGHRRAITVVSPPEIARLARTYNTLPGLHVYFHSCRVDPTSTAYRLTFVSATREVSAFFAGGCINFWQISLNGEPLDPALANVGLTNLVDSLLH